MNRLFIVGAGGFGREVLDYAMAVPETRRDWKLHGFLDSRRDILDGKNCPYPILGDPHTFEFQSSDRVVCAIGDPVIRLKYCRMLKSRGAQFITLFHPTTLIGFNTRIGEGCIFCPGSAVSNNVTVGRFVVFNAHSGAGHDAVIGDGCTFSSLVDVNGWAVLGEGVFLGSHAVVLPKAKVADYTTVGAGSVVLKSTKPHTTVLGVPAVEVFRKES